MLLSSGVNVHGHPSLHIFSKRSVDGKAIHSNLSKGEILYKIPSIYFLDIVLKFNFRLHC